MFATTLRPIPVLLLVAALMGSQSSVPAALAQSKTAPELDESARRAERERRQKAEQEERIHRLVAQSVSHVQETSDLVDRLEQKASTYLPRMTALLTNDDGKRIAHDPTAFLHFVRLQEEPIVSLDEIKARKKSIASLLDGLKKEMEQVGVGYVPDDRVMKDTDEVYAWARECLARLNACDNWLNTVIEKAPKDLDLKKAKTLTGVINEYQANQIELLLRARQVAEIEAQSESEKKVAEAARIAQLEKGNAEAERLLREAREQNERMRIDQELALKQQRDRQEQKIADLERQLAEATASRAKQKAESEVIVKKGEEESAKIRLRHKCEDPDVKAKLAPFLADGYLQPDGSTGIKKQPISLSKLRQVGALNETEEGLTALIAIGANLDDHVRTRWGFPPNIPALAKDSPADLEKVNAAQKYLIELGDTLVELKMLSP